MGAMNEDTKAEIADNLWMKEQVHGRVHCVVCGIVYNDVFADTTFETNGN